MRSPTPGDVICSSGRENGIDSASISQISSRLPARFIPELQRVSRGLDLPPAAKREILEEIAADLVSLADQFRGQGHAAAEADRLALQRLAIDQDTSARLAHLHTTPLERVIRGSARWARTGRDLLIIAGAVVLLVASILFAGGPEAVAGAAPHLWPVGLLATVAALELRQVLRDAAVTPWDAEAVQVRLTRILVLGALSVPTAALVASWRFSQMARLNASRSEPLASGLMALLGECSFLLALGLVFALTIAAAWSVAAGRLQRRLRLEAPASDIFYPFHGGER